MDDKIYTLEDVARELGVSKTTVSRAISGKGRIGNTTRERVLRFIEEHDYRPSVLAKGLATCRTYNIAVVFPLDYTNTEPYFFQECMDGCIGVAFENNYDILVTMADENDLSHIQRLVRDRKVDGMILTRSVNNSSMQDFLKSRKVPFVVLGHVDDPEVISVDNDNRGACRELTDLLLKKESRPLSLIGGDLAHVVTQERYEGFVEAHEKNGIAMEESLIFLGTGGYKKTMESVECSLRAEAGCIVCMDDSIAYMVAACLREMGVAVPGRVRVASFYDSSLMESNVPPVTGIRFDTKSIVRNACGCLLELLGERQRREQLPASYQIIFRKSTQTGGEDTAR